MKVINNFTFFHFLTNICFFNEEKAYKNHKFVMQQNQCNAEIIIRNLMFFLLFCISHDFLSHFHSLPLVKYANSFETKWTRNIT